MKWIRYQYGGTTSYGIVEGDSIEEVSGAPFGQHRLQVFQGLPGLGPDVPRAYQRTVNVPGHLARGEHHPPRRDRNPLGHDPAGNGHAGALQDCLRHG